MFSEVVEKNQVTQATESTLQQSALFKISGYRPKYSTLNWVFETQSEKKQYTECFHLVQIFPNVTHK